MNTKRTMFLLSLLLLLVGCRGEVSVGMLTQAGIGDQGIDEFETEEEVAAWIRMWNTYELDMVGELFLDDPSVTYFSSEKEGLVVGIDTIREHHKGFGFVEGGSEKGTQLWVESLHTKVFGTVAIVKGIWFFRGNSGDEGEVQRGPFTAVYVHDGSDFRIAHMHFSGY